MPHTLSLHDALPGLGNALGERYTGCCELGPETLAVHDQTAMFLDVDAQTLGNITSEHIKLGRTECLAGHRFGHYVSPSKDSNGVLLGKTDTSKGDHDLYLMNAGFESCLKELLGSAAATGIGLNTTRTLAVLGHHASKMDSPASLIRVAKSHLRFGHLEYLFHSQQHGTLRKLMDHCIQRLLPELNETDGRYEQFFAFVVQQTAHLIASWQSSGFTHGLMHTDNMCLSGETFFYGVHGFMANYQPGHLTNPVDHLGRYAFHMQASIGYWNLQMLAKTFTTLVPMPILSHWLGQYDGWLSKTFSAQMQNKFGISMQTSESQAIIDEAFELMATHHLDYHTFFYWLSRLNDTQAEERFLNMPTLANDSATNPKHSDEIVAALDAWLRRYEKLASGQVSYTNMRCHNPNYVLRRHWLNHCVKQPQDISPLLKVLDHPFEHHKSSDAWLVTTPPINKYHS